jgi:hypothetical protein
MSEVTFKITGLSLCKPDFATARGLEVLFIHPTASPEEKHALTVTIKTIPRATSTQPIIETIRILGKTKFSVLLENTVPVTPNGLISFDRTVNFDSFYGRPLSLIKPPYIETSYLSIPQAQPFTANEDYLTYTVIKYTGASSSQVGAGQRVGKKVGVKFRINDAVQGGSEAGRLILRFEGSISIFDKSLPYDAAADYEIEFDNRDVVSEPSDKNDYRLYYNVLDGRDATGKKFTIIFQKEGERADEQACNASQGGGACDFLSFFEDGTCG